MKVFWLDERVKYLGSNPAAIPASLSESNESIRDADLCLARELCTEQRWKSRKKKDVLYAILHPTVNFFDGTAALSTNRPMTQITKPYSLANMSENNQNNNCPPRSSALKDK